MELPGGLTAAQQTALARACAWAREDARVRALLVKGSVARDEADALSDLDLVIVCEPGQRDALWAAREDVAASVGRALGMFQEAPWQAPFTAIALYDGPLKVDFFFHEGKVEPDPWLREGFLVLVDKAGVGADLRRRLERLEPEPLTPDGLRELDAHAWDWLWWMHVKLERGEAWLVYVEMVWFVHTIVLGAHNLLRGEPWMGASRLAARMPGADLEALESALPTSPRAPELRRSLVALLAIHRDLRRRLADVVGVRLPEALARQVEAAIRTTA